MQKLTSQFCWRLVWMAICLICSSYSVAQVPATNTHVVSQDPFLSPDQVNFWSSETPDTLSDPRLPDYYDDLPHLRNATPLGNGLLWSDRRIEVDVLAGSTGSFGLTTLETHSRLSFESLPYVSVNPRFRRHVPDGPQNTDVSTPFYDITLGATLFVPIDSTWAFLGQLGVGLYSDLEDVDSEAVRIPAEGAFYCSAHGVTYVLGGQYLDREDIPALPVFGVIATLPGATGIQAELVFPRPKLSWRFQADETVERAVYVGSELGGGSWRVRRLSGADDMLTLRDIQLNLGVENLVDGRYGWTVETGYVFGRRLFYRSGQRQSFPATAHFSAGLSY